MLTQSSALGTRSGGIHVTTTNFFIPRSIDEAVGLLGQHGPDLVVMGGGTIIMSMLNDGLLFPAKAMSLARAGIDGVRDADGTIEIGATTTIARLAQLDRDWPAIEIAPPGRSADRPPAWTADSNPSTQVDGQPQALQARFQSLELLAQAARLFGAPAVRNMATVGGNLFAAPPAGDIAVPLLALDALVELAGPRGRRTLPLDQFFTGLGQTARAADELVVALHVPHAGGQTAYLRYGRRQANTPAVVAVAARVVLGADGTVAEARIALGAAGPHPLRARQAEAALVGQPLDVASIAAAAQAAQAECSPPTDALASDWYRRKMVGVFVGRALESLPR
jgi:CO/xanthine dehydrogenase FAD-binding subunit